MRKYGFASTALLSSTALLTASTACLLLLQLAYCSTACLLWPEQILGQRLVETRKPDHSIVKLQVAGVQALTMYYYDTAQWGLRLCKCNRLMFWILTDLFNMDSKRWFIHLWSLTDRLIFEFDLTFFKPLIILHTHQIQPDLYLMPDGIRRKASD